LSAVDLSNDKSEPASLISPASDVTDTRQTPITREDCNESPINRQPSPISSSSSPTAAVTASAQQQAELEREREERRERLNQILQRTRMDAGAPPLRPQNNGIDASALAQDLLAQRRQQKLQQQLQPLQDVEITNGHQNGDSVNGASATSENP